MDVQKAIVEAAPGSVVRIPAGRHLGRLVVDKSLTLLGARGAASVLDAEGRGSVVTVQGDVAVKLVDLTLEGGSAQRGGGIVFVGRVLEVTDCLIQRNEASAYGGGGIYAAGQSLTLDRVRILDNDGKQGGGLLADETVQIAASNVLIAKNRALFGGGVLVKEGARADFSLCTIADNEAVGTGAKGSALHLSGTLTRTPAVMLGLSIVTGAVWNASPHPAALTATRSVLPEGAAQPAGNQNRSGAPGFQGSPSAPYALTASSPATGIADSTGVAPQARDILGHPRIRGDKVDAGAYAFQP